METDNVIYIPTPKELTPEQREYWQGQAAYWAVHEENSERALEVAQRGRENALRMLGMLGSRGDCQMEPHEWKSSRKIAEGELTRALALTALREELAYADQPTQEMESIDGN